MRFEAMDVTADVGIVAYGESLPRLFENAALGMFSLIAESSGVEPQGKHEVEVVADDREGLLVAWLREWLYRHEVDGMLFSRFEVTSFEPPPPVPPSAGRGNELPDASGLGEGEVKELRLAGCAWGEPLDRSKHEILRMVKAATYHGLKIEYRGGRWQARIIFDT